MPGEVMPMTMAVSLRAAVCSLALWLAGPLWALDADRPLNLFT
jgi:hypothetical protein